MPQDSQAAIIMYAHVPNASSRVYIFKAVAAVVFFSFILAFTRKIQRPEWPHLFNTGDYRKSAYKPEYCLKHLDQLNGSIRDIRHRNGSSILKRIFDYQPYGEYHEETPSPVFNFTKTAINVSTGRQLFVDMFLVQKVSSGMVQHHNQLDINQKNAIFPNVTVPKGYTALSIMPFAGGVFVDLPVLNGRESLVYTAYFSCERHNKRDPLRAYAEVCVSLSNDTHHWTYPKLLPRNRQPCGSHLDRCIYTIDSHSGLFYRLCSCGSTGPLTVDVSETSNGIFQRILHTPRARDAPGFSYDPYRQRFNIMLRDDLFALIRTLKLWVLEKPIEKSILWDIDLLRCLENKDNTYFKHLKCLDDKGENKSFPPYFAWADLKDPKWNSHGVHPIERFNDTRLTDIYYTDCFAYESLMLCYIGVHVGSNSIPEFIDIHLGTLRDGVQLSRERRKPFVSGTEQFKELGLQGNGPLLINDQLVFLAGVRSMVGKRTKRPHEHFEMEGNTYRATLRRDGFTSMTCEGGIHNKDKKKAALSICGYVITKALVATAADMYINIVTSRSSQSFLKIAIEAFDCGSQSWIFFAEGIVRNNIDDTSFLVNFNNLEVRNVFMSGTFRIIFYFGIEVHLYSFWFSQDGTSHGFNGYSPPHSANQSSIVSKRRLKSAKIAEETFKMNSMQNEVYRMEKQMDETKEQMGEKKKQMEKQMEEKKKQMEKQMDEKKKQMEKQMDETKEQIEKYMQKEIDQTQEKIDQIQKKIDQMYTYRDRL